MNKYTSGTQTTNWTENDDRKMKIFNEIEKMITLYGDYLIDEKWKKAADINIKLSIYIYKHLK